MINYIDRIEASGILEPFSKYNELRSEYITSGIPKGMLNDPALLLRDKNFGEEAAALGTGLHCKFLTPDLFLDEFCVMPEFEKLECFEKNQKPKGTNKYKDMVEEFRLKNFGRTILSEDQMYEISKMNEGLESNPRVQEIMTDKSYAYWTELTFRHEDMQIRTDCLRANTECFDLIDLKTIDCLSNWKRAIYKYGYHIQLDYYAYVLASIIGCPPLRQFIIFVEKQAPWRSAVVKLTPSISDERLERIHQALTSYRERKENDNWRSKYNETIIEFCMED